MGKTHPKQLTLDKALAICIGAGIKVKDNKQEWQVGFQPSEKVVKASTFLSAAGYVTEWVKPEKN